MTNDNTFSKAEAEQEVLRRWRALPVSKRRSHKDAEAFAVQCSDIDFRTLGDARKIIAGWLIRESQAGTVTIVSARPKPAAKRL